MENRYTITKISPWNSRNKHYFEVKDLINKSTKRYSNKDIENIFGSAKKG